MESYIFYNPNPKGKRAVDCTIRAIAKATDQSWDDVYTQMFLKGFEMKDMPASNAVWSAYLIENGFTRFAIPNTCPACYTVRDFARDNPTGTFVLGTGSHAVCVQDGCYYDTWDSGDDMEKITEMMDELDDPKIRQALQKALDKMEG